MKERNLEELVTALNKEARRLERDTTMFTTADLLKEAAHALNYAILNRDYNKAVDDNPCIRCGAPVPEGYGHVCPICEKGGSNEA